MSHKLCPKEDFSITVVSVLTFSLVKEMSYRCLNVIFKIFHFDFHQSDDVV